MTVDIYEVADELAALRAEMRPLQQRASELEGLLKAYGDDAYDTPFGRITVTTITPSPQRRINQQALDLLVGHLLAFGDDQSRQLIADLYKEEERASYQRLSMTLPR